MILYETIKCALMSAHISIPVFCMFCYLKLVYVHRLLANSCEKLMIVADITVSFNAFINVTQCVRTELLRSQMRIVVIFGSDFLSAKFKMTLHAN